MKLQDLLRHIADNVEAGNSMSDGLLYNESSFPPDELPNFMLHGRFSLAPRTHVVNGFTVPAPEMEALENGVRYYYPSSVLEDWYDDCTWDNFKFGNRLLVRGNVFLTPEAAIANAKAEKGTDPFAEGEDKKWQLSSSNFNIKYSEHVENEK